MKTRLLIFLAGLVLSATCNAQLLPMPQVDRDLADISRAADGTAYYGQLLVQSLNSAHAAVWTLPDDRLAAVLNRLGPEAVTGLVELHAATATALNASLDAAGDAGPRALVSPGREFSWEGNSVVIVPREEPEE